MDPPAVESTHIFDLNSPFLMTIRKSQSSFFHRTIVLKYVGKFVEANLLNAKCVTRTVFFLSFEIE